MTYQKFVVDAKLALKAPFPTREEAEILGKFSSIYEENFPKISASSYVQKVVSESYFSKDSKIYCLIFLLLLC